MTKKKKIILIRIQVTVELLSLLQLIDVMTDDYDKFILKNNNP